ncbi:MAG: hypothetical protein R3C11_12780 [Planctomycetaceae bacterium]
MSTTATTYESQRTSKAPVSSLNTADEMQPVDDLTKYVKTYARNNPGTAALWCLGIGFIVGWKLKPW